MKIAVLRANALGDYIFILPALQALKDTFPNAEVVLLGKHWHYEFLRNRPGPVDRVIVIPSYPGVGESEDYEADQNQLKLFFNEMQAEEFDLAFQFHGGGKNSNPFVARLGAKKTVGLKTPDACALDVNISYVYLFSEILRYLEVVAAIGVETTKITPRINVIQEDLDEAKLLLGKSNAARLAIIHPGATDLRRRWPAENFGHIADHLIEQNFLVCLTGTASETKTVARVLEHSRRQSHILNFCGRLNLKGLTGLLSMADILVSNDTGPLHLARALQTRTIGIFWCGNSITGMSMTSNIHRSLISWVFQCPLCGLSFKEFEKERSAGCTHCTSFVSDISIDEVKASLQDIIDLGKKKNRASALENERVVR